ncbi:hypothetical protein SAMN05444422_105226 [Halobiforma haloterrestris]|uniref:Uncharacterized protein n=1 Tax=Natronobacterium haloterrestre TaxID=148448 RepID=A0A1I1H5Z0_NATHA|nr:hypothetical protein SAMN05444422_105226 [Halobiforma haloterrestris]
MALREGSSRRATGSSGPLARSRTWPGGKAMSAPRSGSHGTLGSTDSQTAEAHDFSRGGPIQGLSTSHDRRFSTGFSASRRSGCPGYWREQPPRVYDDDRQAVPLRRTRPVRPVPRDDTRDRRSPVGTRGRAVHVEAYPAPLPASDATAKPRDGHTRPRSHGTASPMALGRSTSATTRTSSRPIVGSNEREATRLLGVSPIHRPTRVYGRRVRHHRRSPLGSVDGPGVSRLWLSRGYDAPPRDTHVFVRLRGTCRPRRARDVPQAVRIDRQADGTARVPQVGRPLMVGVNETRSSRSHTRNRRFLGTSSRAHRLNEEHRNRSIRV